MTFAGKDFMPAFSNRQEFCYTESRETPALSRLRNDSVLSRLARAEAITDTASWSSLSNPTRRSDFKLCIL